VYHYTDKNPKEWETIGILPENAKEVDVFLTTESDFTPFSARQDLSLDKLPAYKIEIPLSELDMSKVDLIRQVNGNVNNQGGGGWEIIFRGPIEKKPTWNTLQFK